MHQVIIDRLFDTTFEHFVVFAILKSSRLNKHVNEIKKPRSGGGEKQETTYISPSTFVTLVAPFSSKFVPRDLKSIGPPHSVKGVLIISTKISIYPWLSNKFCLATRDKLSFGI